MTVVARLYLGGGGPHFLKVLKKKLWVGVHVLKKVPHSCLPTPENTLLVDDSPTKSLLNLPGNTIFPDPWKCNRNDTFLENELGADIKRLACHPGSVPYFVLSNPIGNRPLGPWDEVFRKLYGYAKLNKLIWKFWTFGFVLGFSMFISNRSPHFFLMYFCVLVASPSVPKCRQWPIRISIGPRLPFPWYEWRCNAFTIPIFGRRCRLCCWLL